MARDERRSVPRVRLKVIHRHRLGRRSSRRVSELVFIGGQPKALLDWINMAGDRSPVYIDLDPRRLRKLRGGRNTYAYEGETRDPRYEALRIAGTTLAP
jgi:hypothetical protein